MLRDPATIFHAFIDGCGNLFTGDDDDEKEDDSK